MKKILLTNLWLLIVFVGLSQRGYYYENNFIRLDVSDSSAYYVTVIDSNVNRFEEIYKNDIIKIREKGYLMELERTNQENMISYKSNIYATDNNNFVVVLPTITICLYQEDYGFSDLLRHYHLSVIYSNGHIYRVFCHVSTSEEVLLIISEIYNLENVKWCEPEMLTSCKTTNSLYEQQYYLKNTGQNGGVTGMDVNVEPAWNLSNGSGVVVAVIDEGVDRDHEDLQDRVMEGYTINYPNGLGTPQNSSSSINTCKGHGVACAGIIAATNNSFGIRGIASSAEILPVNIVPNIVVEELSYYGFGTTLEIASAINWAWKRSDILSCSWQCTYSNDVKNAVDSALIFGRDGKGSVIVAASGNNYPNQQSVVFPSSINEVITVGAINKSGVIWGYSQRGTEMDLVAPSGNVNLMGDIVTTDRMGSLGYNTTSNGHYTDKFGGTSAACPQVSGVAALMLSVNPNLTSQEVTSILQTTARDLGTPGFDNTYGYGLVDAHKAVVYAMEYGYGHIAGPENLSGCGVGTYSCDFSHPDIFTYTWTTTSNLSITSNNGSSITVMPSSIGPGTITVEVRQQGRLMYTLTKTISVSSVWTGITPVATAPFHITSSTTWSSETFLPVTAIVDQDATLTVTDDVLCGTYARIIVRPGGKLVVDGGTLTSACTGEMWQGICVEGHSNLHQTSANQGKVVLRNGAAIENALCGIRTGAPGDTSNTSTGGIILAQDATFRNCARAVYMGPYTDYTPSTGILKPNASSFTRCTFTLDNDNLIESYGARFSELTRLWGVAGVRFAGCTFTNTSSIDSRGCGIRAVDAGFRVDTYCSREIMNSDCSCPGQYATHSAFSGFSTAIRVSTTGSPFAVTVDETSFANNSTGISVSGNNHATVTRCQFDLSLTPGLSYGTTGLELSACTGFLVEGNAFSRSTSSFPTYGIKAVGTGISNNSLYRNTFSGLTYGIYSSGDNGGSFSGLRFSCNTFSQNTHDIYVTSGQVAETQGNSAAGADNSFSSGATGNFEVLNPRFQLDYYYSSGGSHSPTAHTSNVLLHPNALANGCASTLCTGGGVIKGLTEYRALSNSIDGVSADNYDADGRTDRIAVLQEMSDITSENIRGIEGGDTIDVVILKDWFSAISETWAKYSLAETEYFSDEDNTPTLLGISALLATPEERDEYDNYMAFNALKESLSGHLHGHANWPSATEGQIAELQRIADAGTGRSSVMARGVLCFFFGICYDDGIQMAETRRAPAKNGEGYMPVLTDDSLSFSIAFGPFFITKHDSLYLGAQSVLFASGASDTVIFNNREYRFFKAIPDVDIQPDYRMYLREDTTTGRLYRYYPEYDIEVITCDLSLQSGDTFCISSGNYPCWIVDSVTYDDGRKVVWFPPVSQSGNFLSAQYPYHTCFIEGIGPTFGPFEIVNRGIAFDLGLLLCVHHNDSLVYMTDTVLGCEQYLVSVPEHPDASMKIYPNPAGNTLHVEFEGTDDPQGTITVTNITGVVVLTRECHEPVTQLDVSNLTPGLYMVAFRNGKGVVVRKFVKM